MGPEFDVAAQNVLGNGGKYKLWFPNYTVQSGRPVSSNNKATTERFSISTQSLDYVLGTFRLPGYESINQPLNTIFSSQDSLEERLAAAGCLHTAVALELSAGQARAAGMTRKPERLTTPPPQRHPHPDSLHRAGPGGVKPGRGQPPKPGRWPGAHLLVSRHSARPAGRTGKSNRASNLKSHPVAFGISRPTRTTTEESTTRLQSGQAADRGLDCCTQSPGPAAGSQLFKASRTPPPLCRARGPQHRGLGRGSAAGPPGRPAARAMARRPPPGIAALNPPGRRQKRYKNSSAGREVEPVITGRSGVVTREQPLPNHGILPTLYAH